jgi:ABC-type transport system involved in multi-copper enzyme maturation permease subunit
MFKIVITKDISLMLKDLRIQIYSGIILLLFIMSAFTFVSNLKKEQKDFQRKINLTYQSNEQYAKNMMRFISNGHLYYFQKPTKEAVVIYKTGFPTKIVSSVTTFTPKSNSKKHHPKNNMSLSWLFIIGIIESFLALLFSYNSISLEKINGTFRLQIINNVSRISVFISKYLGLLLFLTLINLLGMVISSIIIYLLLGTFFSQIIVGGIALLILSVPFLSFFIFSGILISMSRNYRSNIVVALSFWLLFVFIIPQLPYILSNKIYKLQNLSEFRNEVQKQRWAVYDKWSKKYDNKKTGEYKVGGNAYLNEGYRSSAFYEMTEVAGKLYKKRLLDSVKQLEMINKILLISPYSILENSLCEILDLGVERFKNELNQFEEFQSNLRTKFKEIDSKDEKSLHLYYEGAFYDKEVVANKGLTPFTAQPYPNPNELVLTKYIKTNLVKRINKSMLGIMILFALNLIVLSISIFKITRFDVR